MQAVLDPRRSMNRESKLRTRINYVLALREQCNMGGNVLNRPFALKGLSDYIIPA